MAAPPDLRGWVPTAARGQPRGCRRRPPDAPGCPCACHPVAHKDRLCVRGALCAAPPTAHPVTCMPPPLVCLHTCWCAPSPPPGPPQLFTPERQPGAGPRPAAGQPSRGAGAWSPLSGGSGAPPEGPSTGGVGATSWCVEGWKCWLQTTGARPGHTPPSVGLWEEGELAACAHPGISPDFTPRNSLPSLILRRVGGEGASDGRSLRAPPSPAPPQPLRPRQPRADPRRAGQSHRGCPPEESSGEATTLPQ